MLHPHQKAAALRKTLAQKRKDSTASISHVDVLTALWCRPNALGLSLPHLRLFLLAFVALMTRFSRGGWYTQTGFLSRDPQNLLAPWLHGQHRLQQIALMAPIADWT
jgi:hypothetical protein